MTSRLAAVLASVVFLGGCGLLHPGSGNGVRVLGKTQYCGTPSQASAVHYFGGADALGNWIKYRNIPGLDRSLATHGGVIVVAMGQRPTGGYNIKLDPDRVHIVDDTLTVGMTWSAPRLSAAVSQALISECVVLSAPKGQYRTIRVVDQLGNLRGKTRVSGNTEKTSSG